MTMFVVKSIYIQSNGQVYGSIKTLSVFPMQATFMLPEGFPFSQFNLTYGSWRLVPVWRL